MAMMGIVIMFVLATLRFVRDVMMMKMKETLHQEHRQETDEKPGDRPVNRMSLVKSVRKQVQEPHSEHEPGDKADGHLQPLVRKPGRKGKPASGQRGQND